MAGNHFARVLTAIFPYGLSLLFPRNTPKNAETKTAWSLLTPTTIAFVPTKKNRAWLTKGGERNALDDFCDSVGPVVTWFGKWLRGWRVHSYSACDSAGGATYQHNRRSTTSRIGKRTLFALLDARRYLLTSR